MYLKSVFAWKNKSYFKMLLPIEGKFKRVGAILAFLSQNLSLALYKSLNLF